MLCVPILYEERHASIPHLRVRSRTLDVRRGQANRAIAWSMLRGVILLRTHAISTIRWRSRSIRWLSSEEEHVSLPSCQQYRLITARAAHGPHRKLPGKDCPHQRLDHGKKNCTYDRGKWKADRRADHRDQHYDRKVPKAARDRRCTTEGLSSGLDGELRAFRSCHLQEPLVNLMMSPTARTGNAYVSCLDLAGIEFKIAG
jgi:hypothetical protein